MKSQAMDQENYLLNLSDKEFVFRIYLKKKKKLLELNIKTTNF